MMGEKQFPETIDEAVGVAIAALSDENKGPTGIWRIRIQCAERRLGCRRNSLTPRLRGA